MPSAHEILSAHSEIDPIHPHLDQLTGLSAFEWFIILDAVIDRTLPEAWTQGLQQLIDHTNPMIIPHRWHERQLASVELRPALLPWFIRGTL